MSVTTPDQIQAGPYEVAATQLDVITSEPGRPLTYVRHRRGAVVELDAAEARRLVLAGAVVEPGAREKAAAEAAKTAYDAALAALSPEARAAITGQPVGRRRRAVQSTPPAGPAPATPPADQPDDGGDADDEQDKQTGQADGGDADGAGDDGENPERPPRVAAKALWADYAVRTGVMSAEEAEGLTKDDLVARVREHEAAQQGA